jgi:hypothetical protein
VRRGVVLAVVAAGLAASSSAVAAGPAITPAQLALMPLPKAALGPSALSLPLDPDSGVQTNADAASNAFGRVAAADLARIGRLSGYDLDYNDAAGKAIVAGHGLLEAETGVELYRDPASATRGLAFWRQDTTRAAKLHTPGLAFSMTPFPVNGLGPSTFSVSASIKLKGKPPFYGAQIMFQVDRLLAAVSLSSPQASEVQQLAPPLARQLKARIGLVLAGKISGAPVPLPGKAKAGPPPNGLDLSALALRPGDLGQSRLVSQGYRLDTDLNPISEYQRELSPAGSFANFREQVALFHSPTEASYTFGLLAELLSSTQAMKTILGAEKSRDLRSWVATPVSVNAGDEARAVVAKLGGATGVTGYAGFVIVRVGSTTEFVAVVGPAALPIQPAALRRLAAQTAERAQQGLKK